MSKPVNSSIYYLSGSLSTVTGSFTGFLTVGTTPTIISSSKFGNAGNQRTIINTSIPAGTFVDAIVSEITLATGSIFLYL